jgi:DNA polymerase-3 subunit epsilon
MEQLIRKLAAGNFVAFDFETANNSRLSACAIGLVVYEDFQEKEHYYTLIKPQVPGFIHTGIHGIGAADVLQSPTLAEVLHQMYNIIHQMPLVAHNMAFDYGVMKASFEYFGKPMPQHIRFCTLQAARRLAKTANHKLSTLAEYYQIPLQHHEALSDARAAGQLALRFVPYTNLQLACKFG